MGWGADCSRKSAGGRKGLAVWAPGFLGPGREQGHGQETRRRTSVLKPSGQAGKTGSPDGAFRGRKKKVSELPATAVRRVRGGVRGPQASPTGAPAPGGGAPEQLGQPRSEGRKAGGGGRAEEASWAARSRRRLRRGGGDEAGGEGRGGAVGDAPPLLGLAFFSFRTVRVSASLPGAG